MTAEQMPLLDVRTRSGRRSRANLGMTEQELLGAVRRLAAYTGWLVYHTADSRRSEPGFPDVVLTHAKQRRIIFAELKSPTGKTTAEQDLWLTTLAAAGAETALWRPADLADVIPSVLRGSRRLNPEETRRG